MTAGKQNKAKSVKNLKRKGRGIAELVEHLLLNPKSSSSNLGTINVSLLFFKLGSWLQDWNAFQFRYSNHSSDEKKYSKFPTKLSLKSNFTPIHPFIHHLSTKIIHNHFWHLGLILPTKTTKKSLKSVKSFNEKMLIEI